MKIKLFTLVLALALIIVSIPIYAADLEDGDCKDEIPYGEFGNSYKPYTYTSMTIYNEDEAKAAGVPEGYTGYVMKLEGAASGIGIGLDLHKYKTNDIESITFRVWCPAETKSDGVRLTNTETNSWIMLADPGANEEWVEVVLSKGNNFNTSPADFSVMDDGNGYVKDMNFCFRYNANSAVAYIDHITVKLRDPDTVPPVIAYDGDTAINTTAGKVFTLDGASAYDEYDNAIIQPEYIYSEGAIDENGLLLEGEHTCAVRFTDAAGNSSEINLTLKVEAKDVTAPTLSWTVEKLFANVGMRPMLNITATDDRDGEVDVVLTWSDGTLDPRGRFLAGEHTLTITASDKTGNTVEKVIPIIVTGGLPTVE